MEIIDKDIRRSRLQSENDVVAPAARDARLMRDVFKLSDSCVARLFAAA